MSEWREVTLGELGEIFDGPHATPERRNQGPYFLNIASLKDGRLDLSLSDHVDQADYERWTRRVTPEAGDLLFSYETRLGEAAMMPEGIKACLGRRMALFRPSRVVVDPRFMLYLWLSPAFRREISANTIHGATVNRIPLSTMGSWRVSLPSLSKQRAIAEVLGALDDKIEANRKLAATADALARSIFAEAAQDASLSEVTYGDLAKIGGGGTPKSKVEEFWSGGVRWLTPTDVTALPGPYVEETSRRISEAGLASISSPLYPVGSIAMTSRATIGSFAILDRPMAVNQGFIVVEPYDENLRLWIFHEMRRRVREFYDYANGATFMELSRGNFKKIRVYLSDYSTMSRFSKQVGSLHDSARSALRENKSLAQLRNFLLTDMMLGTLRPERLPNF